jgi:lactate dehydrogenase-like 2-hydroxyacid dehydrogenase
MLERESGAGTDRLETEHSKEGSKTMQTVSMTSHVSFSDHHTRYLNAISFNEWHERSMAFP